MTSRETEFFENIGGVKSYTALSASHQRHQATSDREPCDRRCANSNSANKDPIIPFKLAVLPACCQVALDAKDRYRIGGGQIRVCDMKVGARAILRQNG